MATLIFDATTIPPWVEGAKPELPTLAELDATPIITPVVDLEPLPSPIVPVEAIIAQEQPQGVMRDLESGVPVPPRSRRRGRPVGTTKRTFRDFPEGFSEERDLEREAYEAREEWRAAIQLRKETLEAMNEDVRRKVAYAQSLEKKIFARKFKK